jgi:hypothetical protein
MTKRNPFIIPPSERRFIMLFPIIKTNSEPFEKQASILGLLAGMGIGELGMQAASKFGQKRGANLLRTGIDLSQKGEKMAPLTETLSRNLLGNKAMSPYDAGLKIGNKITEKNMEPERAQKFIDRVVKWNVDKKTRLEQAGEKVKDPVLHAMDDYLLFKDLKHPKFQKMLNEGSIPQEKSGAGGKIVGNALTGLAAPQSWGDFRFAARPLVRKAENTPAVQNAQNKLFPAGTMREKGYNMVRNYID